MRRLKGLKHLMNFGHTDSERIKLDRVCRMLRQIDGINYEVSVHEDDPNTTVLWAHGTTRVGIPKGLHQELKARAIGVAFAVDNSSELVGSPIPHYTSTPLIVYAGTDAFVSLPTEEN